jgi:hypothetical protein
MKALFCRFSISNSRPATHRTAMRLPALGLLLLLIACGDDLDPVDASQPDAASSVDGSIADGLAADATPDDAAPDDAALDAASDDATVDAAPDDATLDAAPDDATVDAAPDDAPVDAAPDDATVDAAPDDATVDASVDATVDASVDASVDATVDASVDATVDAAPVDADVTSPVITEVETSGGSTQVRQFSTVTLVITGDRLAAATSVIVGAITAPIVTRSDTQLTVTLAVPHGHAAGPLGVTVTTPDGVVTAPAAVTITHFIVAPTAPPGGRGTYDSPITICDPTLTLGTAGDTFELLAGEHVCNDLLVLTGGFRMIGAGAGVTFVDTAGWEVFTATGTTLIASFTLRRGTFYTSNELPRFTFRDIEAVAMLLDALDRGEATFERIQVVGAGLVSVGGFASMTITDVDLTGPVIGLGTAIQLEEGTATLTGVSIRRFGTGVAITAPATAGTCNHSVTLVGSDLIDVATGIDIGCGRAFLRDTTITDDPLAAPATAIGVDVDAGGVDLREGSRIEVTQIGVRASPGGCGGPEYHSSVVAADSTIIGDVTGVTHTPCDSSGVQLRRSVVRGGTTGLRAGCREASTCSYDLSGGNDLQVTSPTGHALVDDVGNFTEFDAPIDMVGSTLNGRSYAGQLIVGPAQVTPDYRISADGAIQF